ncbi:nucleotide-diphospho-sugar transferase [Coccomyxa subellipsoidea C-169]|uniref:Translation initiation factor eIF2B subunit gamma n=1 Tax=Coccomyxa subellipsoidea (strain C-169) TaxID=574566 RepID=I0YVI4_COCSC|nr:nucleotide-diphospho-sugar transferase [Coccomyxa subellipsoidea C-169]EIE22403.1 nucleotide-diphospho-sugar transferase [Coccomyxa subellipsoidea C-169]|eukprot:XP_005646947.1 nucleotide-diphospho-sugar transferase [Coccomyxa subellipsoidea C-169]
MGPQGYQAVLLAGGSGTNLFPLNQTGLPLSLLPVANQPLITYPLKTLEGAGIVDVLVVCLGETTAAKVSTWISKNYSGKLQLKVKSVPEDSESAEALRAVAEYITGKNVIVMSVDLITDVRLEALMAVHFIRSAMATVLLSQRRTSPSSETKPGKAPKEVEYVGLDEQQQQLLFFRPSPESRRSIRLPMNALLRHKQLTVRTDLQDNHLYIFNRAVLEILHAKPNLANIKQVLLPFAFSVACSHPCCQDFMALSHSAAAEEEQSRGNWYCGAFVVGKDNYCARTSTLQAFCEVINTDLAGRLGVKAQPNTKFDNFLHDSVQMGYKTTVAAGCMVGRGTTMADKCSIKRSVLGAMCKLGSNVKIINCVLMDGVEVQDGCHLQNSIICPNAHLQERVTLRDCHVGPGTVVSEGLEHREEVLAKAAQRRSSEYK